ncbi:unnamed protein product, partial [marine sediment metagenome]
MAKAKVAKCGAKTRRGKPCQHEAGWGTDHVGEGKCKQHGGRSLRGRAHPAYRHGKHMMPSLPPPIDIDRWQRFQESYDP